MTFEEIKKNQIKWKETIEKMMAACYNEAKKEISKYYEVNNIEELKKTLVEVIINKNDIIVRNFL